MNDRSPVDSSAAAPVDAPEDPSAVERALEPLTEPLADVVASPTRFLLFLAVTVATVVVDQITKVVAVAQLVPGESPALLGGLVHLSLIRNPGAAFSLASGMTWVLALLAVVIVVVIVQIARRMSSVPWAVGLGLVLGGAVGNLLDRVFRAPGFLSGHVVDFLSFGGPDGPYLPVVNVADLAILGGALTVLVTTLRGRNVDGQPFDSPTAAARETRPAPGAVG